jgi:outer membrane lipoprotein-sorting protein
MTKRRALLFLFLLICWISSGAASTESESVPDPLAEPRELLARLEERAAELQTLKADFIQEKHLAVLDRPLVLKGTLFMQKPDHFAWIVREPLGYSMVIRGDVVHQWSEDTRQVDRISLSENPQFQMAIRQMRDWLSGSYRSILGDYAVSVLDREPLRLQFVPRETALPRGLIESVTIEFERDERYVHQITIVETRGDWSLLTFVDALLNDPIAPSAWDVEQHVR